jgi:hypothetical protein
MTRRKSQSPSASSCRCRRTCRARPEPAHRTPGRQADWRGDGRVSCALRRAAPRRARAASGRANGQSVGSACGAWAPRSAPHGPASPRSPLASTGSGSNSAGGPSRFGASTALERSRPRNWSGRYSSAIDTPLQPNSRAQVVAMHRFFTTIRGLLKSLGIRQRCLI